MKITLIQSLSINLPTALCALLLQVLGFPIRDPHAALIPQYSQLEVIQVVNRLDRNAILEVDIAKHVVANVHVSLEAQFTFDIEPTLLDVADYARVGQVVHLLELLRTVYCEAVDHDGQDEREDYLVYEYDVDVLEDAEEADLVDHLGRLLEEVAHEPVDGLEGGEEDEGEALT